MAPSLLPARVSRVLLLVVAGGCVAYPPEPHNPARHERPWGVATGATPSEARELAARVEDARAALAGLPWFEERPLRIHMAADLGRGMSGVTVQRLGRPPYVLVDRGALSIPHTVAHELVHLYFAQLGDALPAVVEEGLCEVLAAQVTGGRDVLEQRVTLAAVSYLEQVKVVIEGVGVRQVMAYLGQEVPGVEAALKLDSDELFRASSRQKLAYYGLGTAIFGAIGLEGVVAMVERGRLDGVERLNPEVILLLAGLDPLTDDALCRAFARTLGETNVESQDLTLTFTFEATADGS